MSLLNEAPTDSPQWFKTWIDDTNRDNTVGVVLFAKGLTVMEGKVESILKNMATKDDIKKFEELIKNNHS